MKRYTMYAYEILKPESRLIYIPGQIMKFWSWISFVLREEGKKLFRKVKLWDFQNTVRVAYVKLKP